MDMKRFFDKYLPVIPVALILGTVLFSHSCANTTTPPSGGPKDTIPPVLVEIFPYPGATHVPVLLTLVSCGIGISTLSDDMACLCQGKVAFIPLLGVPFSNVRLMWNENNQNPALPHLLDVVRSLCETKTGC